MTPSPIKFGTDGWRGVIAEDFTFANVRIAAAAIANYVLDREDWTKGICIGYDTRFGSPAFARTVADVAASAGIPVRLAAAITPTPALSYGGPAVGGGRRYHDHLKPQSISVEWREVQGQLWRVRLTGHHGED